MVNGSLIAIAITVALGSANTVYAADRGDSSTGGGTEMSTGDMAGSKHKGTHHKDHSRMEGDSGTPEGARRGAPSGSTEALSDRSPEVASGSKEANVQEGN